MRKLRSYYHQNTKFKLPKNYVVIGIISLFIIVVILFAFFSIHNKHKIMRAEKLSEVIFVDQEHEMIDEKLEESTFQNYVDVTQKIKGKEGQKHQQLAQEAYSKYRGLTMLNDSIYEQELTQQMLSESTSDQMPLFKSELTIDGIIKLKDQYSTDQLGQDDLANGIKHYYNYAINTPEIQKQLKAYDFPNIEELSYEDHLHTIVEIEALDKEVSSYAHQPLLEQDFKTYKNWADEWLDTLLVLYDDIGFDWSVMESIGSLQVFGERITDTPFYSDKVIALTFDDGPNETYTTQILDILAEHDVKATFFVSGAYVDDHPGIARRIVSEGHIIGNHSYTHPDFTQISDAEIIQEIEWTQESIYDATGYEPNLYRLPFGAGGERVVKLLKPMTSIIWNVDSMDWQLQNKDLIVQNVMDLLLPRTLLLMHDTNQASVDAVAELIPMLKDMNYEFVFPEEVGFDYHYFD